VGRREIDTNHPRAIPCCKYLTFPIHAPSASTEALDCLCCPNRPTATVYLRADGSAKEAQIICPDETYPCGDSCLEVVGNHLPQCGLTPSRAVSFGAHGNPGSLEAYGGMLDDLSQEDLRRRKADLAYSKAATVDAHIASPALAVRVLQVQSEALCYTISCPGADQCNEESRCFGGVCRQQEPKSDGSPCDDGQEATDEDKCEAGVCVGIDYCDGVTCTARDQCHTAGTCSRGTCTEPQKDDNSPCDDGQEATDEDSCQHGVCVGIDYCDGVTCIARDQCHIAGTCSRGTCTEPQKDDNSTCDDGQEATDEDSCQRGVCVGIDYCDGVTCMPLDQCHTVGICSHGTCTNPVAEVGTKCDDGNLMTDFDQVSLHPSPSIF